jgi:hypothetical protein
MIALPRFRFNFKPLVPAGALDKVEPRKVLQAAQREILKQIRTRIQEAAFSPRAKRALSKGLRTRIGQRSITVIATHPAFFPLLQGQKRQQMSWLTKATRPIPIILDNGELIFRNASPRSMARGRWYHPGRQNSHVIDKAREATRDVIKRRIGKAVLGQLQYAMKKANK